MQSVRLLLQWFSKQIFVVQSDSIVNPYAVDVVVVNPHGLLHDQLEPHTYCTVDEVANNFLDTF